jgi:hypothetical protein
MGGGELAREFLQLDLLDELQICVLPVLIGEGISLFPSGYPQRNFTLLEKKTHSRGLISLTYERTRTKRKSKAIRQPEHSRRHLALFHFFTLTSFSLLAPDTPPLISDILSNSAPSFHSPRP